MRLPFTSWTITVTRGSRTSGDSLSWTLFSSCAGVSPSAGTSPSSGSVIFPSGLTGTITERSASLQTATSTHTSLASRYSCTTCWTSSCWDPPPCAQPDPNASSAAAGPHHDLQLPDIESLLRHRRTGGSRTGSRSTARARPPGTQESPPCLPCGNFRAYGRALLRLAAVRVPLCSTRMERQFPLSWKVRLCTRVGVDRAGGDERRTSHRARPHEDVRLHAPHHRRRRHRVRRRRLRPAERLARALRGAAPAPLDGDALPARRQAARAAREAQRATSRAGRIRSRARSSIDPPARSAPLRARSAP